MPARIDRARGRRFRASVQRGHEARAPLRRRSRPIASNAEGLHPSRLWKGRASSRQPAEALQMPLRDLEERSRGGGDTTAAGMNRIEGSRRRRMRIEHLDESIGRKPIGDGGRWKTRDAEPSRRGVARERDAVDHQPRAERDLDGATARTERPSPSRRERREDDALVPTEVAWREGRSAIAQVLAARKATELCARGGRLPPSLRSCRSGPLMHLSQNARFVAAFPVDPEFDHPPGAWLARRVQAVLGEQSWVTDEFDNWRDCGWVVRCKRGEADLEVRFAALAAGNDQWSLQVTPTRSRGLLGRLVGGRASATPHDCFVLARAVDACLLATGKCSALRWAWDGDPETVPSAESPLPPK